jgi:hypothetical protein
MLRRWLPVWTLRLPKPSVPEYDCLLL